ncbi:MAG: helix-turn-helix transcriptional regulator [Granulosicoccaceae bacterium]
MKRFDRLIAILMQLQTSRLVRATDLAERYGVSERTIYRDMRSLENAGVPLVAEAGLGYYLDRSYQLPAINFSPDEAIALLVGVKGVQAHVAGPLSQRAESAMDKLLAVMDSQQQNRIRDLQARIAISGTQPTAHTTQDESFDTCQQALMTRRQLWLSYTALYNGETSERQVEPVGLSHYAGNWHLIAWCQLRTAMRDFRLDRIGDLEVLPEACPNREIRSLKGYFATLKDKYTLQQIKVCFATDKAYLVDSERYKYGYLGSEICGDKEVMTFLTAYPEYLGRWLLKFTCAVLSVEGEGMLETMKKLVDELAHYQ